MWLLSFFGLLMMVISLVMIKNPQTFATGIIKFSQQTYFHVFEILSRLFFGVVFVYYSPLTLAPIMNATLGYLMLLVAILLLVIGADKHRTFALWSAEKFSTTFRVSGFFSFIFGSYIIYTTW
ncbi:hypothetical protein [Cognaticolwellia beringensis]|uniref:Uncharacterized protein n=1 Tax=Cognaticolwellia beringensis TaxID=1967665 RepID=A0A222G6U6_9GAMM|nr:hypothetical protein [Cognaticolwellia beringensis]ASP47520.1 hypothetical protein B5D82_06990 [Cognaticolwellia beringensis]|tara:strand:+ start:2449 stop:2817 length:369 start_codon:yes stop_codon:yes gene_type:complete